MVANLNVNPGSIVPTRGTTASNTGGPSISPSNLSFNNIMVGAIYNVASPTSTSSSTQPSTSTAPIRTFPNILSNAQSSPSSTPTITSSVPSKTTFTPTVTSTTTFTSIAPSTPTFAPTPRLTPFTPRLTPFTPRLTPFTPTFAPTFTPSFPTFRPIPALTLPSIIRPRISLDKIEPELKLGKKAEQKKVSPQTSKSEVQPTKITTKDVARKLVQSRVVPKTVAKISRAGKAIKQNVSRTLRTSKSVSASRTNGKAKGRSTGKAKPPPKAVAKLVLDIKNIDNKIKIQSLMKAFVSRIKPKSESVKRPDITTGKPAETINAKAEAKKLMQQMRMKNILLKNGKLQERLTRSPVSRTAESLAAGTGKNRLKEKEVKDFTKEKLGKETEKPIISEVDGKRSTEEGQHTRRDTTRKA